MDLPVTKRQIEYIEALAHNLGWDYHRVHLLTKKNNIMFSGGYQNLSLKGASKLIGLLREQLGLDPIT